jgi:hypothetical protein
LAQDVKKESALVGPLQRCIRLLHGSENVIDLSNRYKDQVVWNGHRKVKGY